MSMEHTAKVMEGYWSGHDPEAVAEDAVFYDVGAGNRTEGREAINEMLSFVYEVAFDARFVPERTIISDGRAAVEGRLVGRHIGEFAGVQATNRDVDVPLAVTYTVEDRGITEAHIWFMLSNFLEQVTDRA